MNKYILLRPDQYLALKQKNTLDLEDHKKKILSLESQLHNIIGAPRTSAPPSKKSTKKRQLSPFEKYALYQPALRSYLKWRNQLYTPDILEQEKKLEDKEKEEKEEKGEKGEKEDSEEEEGKEGDEDKVKREENTADSGIYHNKGPSEVDIFNDLVKRLKTSGRWVENPSSNKKVLSDGVPANNSRPYYEESLAQRPIKEEVVTPSTSQQWTDRGTHAASVVPYSKSEKLWQSDSNRDMLGRPAPPGGFRRSSLGKKNLFTTTSGSGVRKWGSGVRKWVTL